MPDSPSRAAAALLALGLASGLLTSCGTDDGRVTITWYANPDQGGQAAVAKKCSTDKVKVDIQVLPQDAGQQRIQLARRLAAEDPGIDLMSLDPVFNAEFANAGFLAKVPDALQRKLKEQSFTGAVDAATWDDELVALPFWSNTQLLWYRKDAAKAAGLDLTQPVTWKQVIDAATKLNSENRAKTTHVGVQANKYEGYVVWINALIAGAGGTVVRNAEKGIDATIDVDSDPGRAAAKVVEQLAGSSAAEPDLSVSNEGTVLPFLYPHDRKAVLPDVGGFLVDWTFVYSNFKGLVGKSVTSGGITKKDFANLGWAPYPRTVAGKPAAPPYGGINIGVSKYSSHPDEAMAAAACIVEPDNQGINADLTGNMPASAEGYDYPALLKTYPQDLLDMLQAGLEAASPRPATPYWSDISGAIQATWHSPRAVGPDTPKKSAEFIVDVLKGRRLL